MPLLTPSSKEMMSQALKATFSGFAKEQQRLGIPKGKTWDETLQVFIHWDSCSTVCVLFSWGNGLWLLIRGSLLQPLGADPQQWTETHVRDWVMWAVNEFSLKGVEFQKFCMNGAALCALGKECFLELAPDFVGDILWEHLEILQKGESWSLQGEWLMAGLILGLSEDLGWQPGCAMRCSP